jgi:hypothetical protein
MEIAAINQRDFNGRAFQGLRCSQPSKSAAQDYYPMRLFRHADPATFSNLSIIISFPGSASNANRRAAQFYDRRFALLYDGNP